MFVITAILFACVIAVVFRIQYLEWSRWTLDRRRQRMRYLLNMREEAEEQAYRKHIRSMLPMWRMLRAMTKIGESASRARDGFSMFSSHMKAVEKS